MIASTRHPHDAEAVAALIERDMKRAQDFRSVTNHFMLLGDDGGSELKAADIKVPILVIHGTSDPLFPVEHGEAFAGVVPGARLVRIDGEATRSIRAILKRLSPRSRDMREPENRSPRPDLDEAKTANMLYGICCRQASIARMSRSLQSVLADGADVVVASDSAGHDGLACRFADGNRRFGADCRARSA
jgi:hypothetical protein